MRTETTKEAGGVAVGTEATKEAGDMATRTEPAKEAEDMATETETTKGAGDIAAAMKEDYQTNESFRAYVDKHAVRGGITVDVALTHQIVKDVWEDMKKESKGIWRGIGS